MIYGVIPVGGKGTRLGLPFPKEMLPQKNFDYYNPIINHLVEKMEMAGATKIVFVHGENFKIDIVDFFDKEKYVHIGQMKSGFARCLKDFYESQRPNDEDSILFGLPDSIFDRNPLVEMLNMSGTVCGLFTTNKLSKVDRLKLKEDEFDVKSVKNENNGDYFWGVLKFDGFDLRIMNEDNVFDTTDEIGEILNKYSKKYVFAGTYLDIGTWENYNRYAASMNAFSNTEIERKYDASNIDPHDIQMLFANSTVMIEIESTDHYFSNDNDKIEFVRYRQDDVEGAKPDITIKNFNVSQMNRFELTVNLQNKTNPKDVMYFLKLLGCKYEFSVTKKCQIYTCKGYTFVYYEFKVDGKLFKIIEVELEKVDFNILTQVEDMLVELPGFDPTAVITKSKYQMIKEYLNDSTY